MAAAAADAADAKLDEVACGSITYRVGMAQPRNAHRTSLDLHKQYAWLYYALIKTIL